MEDFVNVTLPKNELLFVSKTIREVLFDDNQNPFSNNNETLDTTEDDSFSVFGLLFGHNNTWYYDGVLNINTGRDNKYSNHLILVTSILMTLVKLLFVFLH